MAAAYRIEIELLTMDNINNCFLNFKNFTSVADAFYRTHFYKTGQCYNAQQGCVNMNTYQSYHDRMNKCKNDYVVKLAQDSQASTHTLNVNNNTLTIEGVFAIAPEVFTTYDNFNIVITQLYNFEINSIELTSNNDCDYINVTVNTEGDFNKINSPITATFNNTNSYTFAVLRYNSSIHIEIENSDGIILNDDIFILDKLENIDIVTSVNLNNLFVNNTDNNFELQYKVDNGQYQVNNIFTNLSTGQHILHIKDQYNCTRDIDFTISDIDTTIEPYFYISKSNSLRFINRTDLSLNCDSSQFNKCNKYINEENSYGEEWPSEVAYNGNQLFNKCDVITTQFKSNYDNNCKILLNNNVIDNIDIIKISNFMNVNDKRTCRIKPRIINDNNIVTEVGIYFIKGDILDYNNNSFISEYNIGSELPEWAKLNSIFVFDNVNYLIDKIIYDDELDAFTIIINTSINISDINNTHIASATYNINNYEVYQFTIDMNNFVDKNIQVLLTAENDNYRNLTFITELLIIRHNHKNSLLIEYWNNKVTDIYYNSDLDIMIRHKLRLNFEFIDPNSDNKSSTLKTDNNINIYNVSNYEITKIKFEAIITQIYRKLLLASNHDNIIINNINMSKKSFTHEKLGKSNLQIVTASYYKKDKGIEIGISNYSGLF